jgi:GAF domain-containing protein
MRSHPAPTETPLIDAIETVANSSDFTNLAHFLCTTCVTALEAEASGMMITDVTGRLRVLGSSDEDTHSLELLEVQGQEGPCYESAVTGHIVLREDLSVAIGWDHFRAQAADLGYRSAIAVPILVHGKPIGALNIFWKKPQKFSDHTIRFARAVADLAAIGLAFQDRVADAQSLALRLADSTQTRIMIEQAKGMLAVQAHVSMNEAFELMRGYHNETGTTLDSIAASVISRTLRASDMNPTAN